MASGRSRRSPLLVGLRAAYTITATPTFTLNTHHAPVSTQASAAVNLTADTAIVSSSGAGYQEHGGTFATIADSAAYGGQYREMTGSDTGTSVTYTFTGLAPGNYEIWDQYAAGSDHPASVSLYVYDGDTSGRLQQTFTINETTSDNWPNQAFEGPGGYEWGWSEGFVYANTDTITVKLASAGAGTEVPTIRLIADPESLAPYIAGTQGAPRCRRTAWNTPPARFSPPGAEPPWASPATTTLRPPPTRASATPRKADYTPQQSGGGALTAVSGNITSCPGNPFEPQLNYIFLSSSKDTMVDSGTHLTLTVPEGNVYDFTEPSSTQGPWASGVWESTTSAGGQVTAVTEWINSSGDVSNTYVYGDQPEEVDYTMPSASQPYETDVYQYLPSSDPNAGLVWHLTVSSTLNGVLTPVEKFTYQYYVTGSGYGLTGDLESIQVQYWNGSTYTGNDAYYFRYYTGPAWVANEPHTDANLIGFAHGLEYELTPQAVQAVGGLGEAENLTNQPSGASSIGAVASDYYQYDQYRRVTLQTVDGGLRTETFSYVEGTDDVIANPQTGSFANLNAWTTETIANTYSGGVANDAPAGALYSTYTVYTNALGQTLFSDLSNDLSGAAANNTFGYDQYDSSGRPILMAASSAVGGLASNGVAGGSYVIQVNGGNGPVQEYTYYTDTTATATTPGDAAGYLESTSIADGITGTPILQEQYSYYQVTDGTATVYPVATDTTYTGTDGSSGAATTSYAYTWYSGTVQEATVTAALPQNASGVTGTTIDFYDPSGNLTWSQDADGYLTLNQYDATTGLLMETVQNVDTNNLPPEIANFLDPVVRPDYPHTTTLVQTPTGDTLNLNATTDYSYDSQGRLAQTLGPVHSAEVDGQSEDVRTATWTVYEDAIHQVITAQGYDALDGAVTGYYLVNPVSVEVTNAGGEATGDIQAAVVASGGAASWVAKADASDEVSLGSAPLTTLAGLGDVTGSPSAYTSWTTYKYNANYQLAGSRTYYAIPASGTGTATDNYDQTCYDYDFLGRLQSTKTPAGTIMWDVYDYRGLVTSTWVGTCAWGATPTQPNEGPSQYNNLVDVIDYQYDNGQSGGDGLLTMTTQNVGSGSPNQVTEYGYDWRNRLLWTMTYDGTNYTYTYNTYDNLNEVVETQTYQAVGGIANPSGDTLLAESTAAYDPLGQVYQSSTYVENTSGGQTVWTPQTTTYCYDPDGNQVGLTDPEGNQTTWQFDGLGDTVQQTNPLGSEYYYYNGAGELTEEIDADGRATTYAYDGIGRETQENWYNSTGTLTETISHTYNPAGLLASATDQATGSSPATDTYTYDDAGEMTSETQQIPGLAPVATLNDQYTAGNRTQLSAVIGAEGARTTISSTRISTTASTAK